MMTKKLRELCPAPTVRDSIQRLSAHASSPARSSCPAQGRACEVLWRRHLHARKTVGVASNGKKRMKIRHVEQEAFIAALSTGDAGNDRDIEGQDPCRPEDRRLMLEVYIRAVLYETLRYCGINTYVAMTWVRRNRGKSGANMVIREMATCVIGRNVGIVEPPAGTVFFGGGTPTKRRIWWPCWMPYARHGNRGQRRDHRGEPPDTVNADYVKELAGGGLTYFLRGLRFRIVRRR